MTVGDLLARISSAELTEWIAYEEIAGPLGPERADLHTGIIAATIANNNPNRKKNARKAKPADFIPRWDRRAQTPEEQLAMLQRANTHFGGTTGRYGKPVTGATATSQRYQVRDTDGMATVVDTYTGATEWTGLDDEQARLIADRFNTT